MERNDLVTMKVAVGLMFATVGNLQAYTDPGSGALFLQVISAAAIGGLFYWRKVTGWVKRMLIHKDDVAR